MIMGMSLETYRTLRRPHRIPPLHMTPVFLTSQNLLATHHLTILILAMMHLLPVLIAVLLGLITVLVILDLEQEMTSTEH